MPYSSDEIKALLSQGENEQVEFKTRIRDASTLGRLISGFANANGGLILIGVGSHGEVVGADTDEVSRVFHLGLAHLVNAPKVDLHATPVDGKRIATITVGKSDRLTVSDAGVFRRVDDRDEPMPAAAILQLLQQHGAAPSEAQALATAIHQLTSKIDDLQRQVTRSNSFRGQLRNYILSGVVGAVLGVILSLIVA